MLKIFMIVNFVLLFYILNLYPNLINVFSEEPLVNATKEKLQQNINQSIGLELNNNDKSNLTSLTGVEGNTSLMQELGSSESYDFVETEESEIESYDFIEDEELGYSEPTETSTVPSDFIENNDVQPYDFYSQPYDFVETEESEIESYDFIEDEELGYSEPAKPADASDFIDPLLTPNTTEVAPYDFVDPPTIQPPSASAAKASNFTGPPKEMPEPEDFIDSSSSQFQSTVHIIAEDLKNIEVNEIEDYPLVSIKDEELKLIFKLLDPTTLTKVLMNIPASDIQKIQEKITLPEYNKIVNKISETDRNQINSRVQ